MTIERTPAERLRAVRSLFVAQSQEAPGEVKADINVTPLVDVVLVLLIIFMVVTPLISSGVAVDLPRTRHHERKPDDGKDIIISVTAEKRYYVGSQRVDRLEDLAAAVSREKTRFPGKSLYFKADHRVAFGVVRRALDALYAADLRDVSLGTEALDEK